MCVMSWEFRNTMAIDCGGPILDYEVLHSKNEYD